ncbi:MAG: hypothetical protein PHV57_03310 [Methanomicrobiaceae archaeon]|nr:hypothetical protein [Methanomicrobiaceae archaeon]
MYTRRLITLFFIVALIGAAAAVSPPPALPAEFYGTATQNGAPVPAGTVIVARINNADRGSITVGEEGSFGGQGTFAERLYVTAKEEDLAETDSPTISFWIGSTKADQEVAFSSGDVMHLDLIFRSKPTDPADPTPTPVTPTPGTGGGGGSGGSGGGSGGSRFVFEPGATPTPTPTTATPQPTAVTKTPVPTATVEEATPTAAKPWFSLPIPLAPWTALAAFAVLLLFRRR